MATIVIDPEEGERIKAQAPPARPGRPEGGIALLLRQGRVAWAPGKTQPVSATYMKKQGYRVHCTSGILDGVAGRYWWAEPIEATES